MRTEPSLTDDPEGLTPAKRDNRHSVTLDLHSSVAMALFAVLLALVLVVGALTR
jgi:hypothetical protein